MVRLSLDSSLDKNKHKITQWRKAMRVLTSCWFLPTVAAFSITALTGSLSKFISKTVPPEYLATATIDLHEKSSAAMNFLSHIQHFAHHYQNYLIGGLVAIAIFTPFAWVWWK